MAGLITEDTKEQIRAASPIQDVIASYIGPLKQAGINLLALCPFHKEKTPSFNVNPGRQSFHCFGCDAGGDVFGFVMQYENVTFMEALKRLAERASIPIELDNDPEAGKRRHLKEILFEMHEKLTLHWQTALKDLPAGQIARDYLARRGVAEEAVERFRLGFAPNEWDDTVKWANANKYDLELVTKGGLVVKKEETNRFYDRFRGRLMFPIADEQGRVIGFSGRILNDEDKAAKYVNSPETPLFSKGRVIYGMDKARRPIADAGAAIVCEGQLDLIRCHVSGIENVVAPQGTALTSDQGRIIKRYADEVVMCFDSDQAGQKAAVRSLEALTPVGLSVRVLSLPAPHDPDSFIREFGPEAFRQRATEAKEYFEFYLDRLCDANNPGTDRGRKVVLKEMALALAKTNDAVLTDTWMRKVAARFGVSIEAVKSESRKVRQSQYPQRVYDSEPEFDSEPIQIEPPSMLEEHLLRLFFQMSPTDPELVQSINLDWIHHGSVRAILDQHLRQMREGTWDGTTPLYTYFEEDPFSRSLISRLIAEAQKLPHPTQQFWDVLNRLRRQNIDRDLSGINQRMRNPATTDEEQVSLLIEREELRQSKAERIEAD
ncbi:MAG: DNA primase [Limisphaerales bacterium]|jgi:DNA primase